MIIFRSEKIFLFRLFTEFDETRLAYVSYLYAHAALLRLTVCNYRPVSQANSTLQRR